MVLKVQPEGISICEESVVWYRTIDDGVVEDLNDHGAEAIEKSMHEEKFWLMGK